MRGLDGKISVIAGAAPDNIGAHTALRLASEGATVVVADLRLEVAEAVADAVERSGGRALAVAVDIAEESSFETPLEKARGTFGGVDHLFNVAAEPGIDAALASDVFASSPRDHLISASRDTPARSTSRP